MKKINNWSDFKDYCSSLPNTKAVGDAFERLTKHYLKYDPVYATKLKSVWLLSEVPKNIHKKLNLPKQDQGIDLICETKEGEYWAVQSKYHKDETTSQTWKSLSTFTGLAFGVCKNISFGLVCTTAERFTKTLENQDKISFCSGEVWRGLNKDFFISLTRKRKPKKLIPLKPYKHKQKIIKDGYKHFVTEKSSRGKMIMPCGTGKSLTAFWIAEKMDSQRILIAVPSLALIRQTLQVWLRETYAKGWDADWITVCSDKTVSKIKNDDLAVLTQDLGIPAVTDPKIIAKWLRKRRRGKTIVFTTYQSGKAIAEASKIAKRNFDLGIMDEAHKTVGSKDKNFSHLLFDKNIKIAKRLFMTATERRYVGKKDDVISMDDMDVYGDTFEFLSFKNALEVSPPILSDYKIVTMMISKDEVADLVKKQAFVQPTTGKWNKNIEADTLAAMIALRKAIRRFRIKHAITFHSSIAKAKAFGDNQPIFTGLFPQYWKTDNFHVSGRMPTSLRDRYMQEFKASKRAIMTNARCLTEGVDVPDIDCVLFADPKKSTIDIVQAVGRALRVSEGKKFAYVIVPVMIEDAENFDESEAFQSILMTLRALASNDERIIDYFRSISQNKRSNSNFQIEVNERIAKKINVKDFTRELELQVWSKLARLSWMPFEEVKAFAQSINLESSSEWYNRFAKNKHIYKLPADIPIHPDLVYADKGWTNWGEFLGTGYVANQLREYRNYDSAKEFVHQLKLKSSEWILYIKGELPHLPPLPEDIPKSPQTYGDAFLGMSDFLGHKRSGGRVKYLDFEDARKFVQKLGLKSHREWRLYCQGKLPGKGTKPLNIPSHPYVVYKGHFISQSDFMGSPPPKNAKIDRSKMLSYDECKKVVIQLGLKTQTDFHNCKKDKLLPENFPKTPHVYFKKSNEWIHWGDFLGTYTISPKDRKHLPYEKAKKFVHKLKLKSQSEWHKYCNGEYIDKPPLPEIIPKAPDQFYKNDFKSLGDWLGTGVVQTQKRQYLTYKDAKEFVHKLKLKSWDEWMLYRKGEYTDKPLLPENIPASPSTVYKKKGKWISWPDYLGYKPKRKKK